MHNEHLTVFCITCNSIICHRCALFDSSAHSGHSFQPVEEIYNETLEQLGQICDNLKRKEELIKKDIKELVSILMLLIGIIVLIIMYLHIFIFIFLCNSKNRRVRNKLVLC